MDRDAIRARLFAPPELEEVEVPEWGGTVKVRQLLWVERNHIFVQADALAEQHGINRDEVAGALGILAGIVDDDGNSVMEPDDIHKVSLEQLLVAMRAVKQATASVSMDDREGNSADTPSKS